MSKMGNWVMEMQEDAAEMSFATFTRVHGRSQASIWREVNGKLYNRPTRGFAKAVYEFNSQTVEEMA